jgi:hypothetical protein
MVSRHAIVVSLVAASAAFAAHPGFAADVEPRLASYLPAGTTYRSDVPTPASVFGFEIGQRPLTPLELETYLRRLAASSDRVRVEEQGRTHEGRPQLLVTLSSPANLARLEELRQAHLALSEGEAPPGGDGAQEPPLVVWLAYSIHGNETSGSNASPLVAYHLAAAQDKAVEDLLANTIVLIDPSQNPDGMARFSQWVISHGSVVPVASPDHREKREPWPGGRGNHYWFDLNRDWLATEHPESRHRVATFQRWRPHVVGDFHEMRGGASYFFQPGVPERTHPLTPRRNQELTAALARYHAAALDRAGRRYFSRESFDDFFYGKGSTYPDIQGAVGILFEQGSTEGMVGETDDGGTIAFATSIHNQLLTSLSTLEGAHALRGDLMAHQREFYREAHGRALRDPVQGWVCGGEPGRVDGFARVLRRHGVTLTALGDPLAAGGRSFAPDAAFVVPGRQRQRPLVEAMFEQRTELPTHVFYDISAWTLPLAWGVDCEALDARVLPASDGDTPFGRETLPAGELQRAPAAVAWVFDWAGHLAPRALFRLLDRGVVVRAATQPTTVTTATGERRVERGALIVSSAGQRSTPAELETLLAEVAAETGVDIWAVTRGLAVAGLDLGSPNVVALSRPRVALVVGEGADGPATGEVWHFFDRHLEVPVVLLDRADVGAATLAGFSHLLLADGSWDGLPAGAGEAVGAWVRAGGVFVGLERGSRWAHERLLSEPAAAGATPAAPASQVEPPPLAGRYEAHATESAERLIAGAIVELELDPSHPLAFGYAGDRIAGFRSSARLLPVPANPYDLVARYAHEPVRAGYVSADNAARLSGAPALLATRLGEGLVVRFADDPVFRGGWHGTERLLANSVFFAGLVEDRAQPASQ